MIRIRLLTSMLTVGVLFAPAGPMAFAADNEEILSARTEVLEELAEEGVFDAYYELAGLIAAHPGSTRFARDKATRYLAVSASSGRGSAVRWLAYRLLRDFDVDHEAATLIALAALLGDERAAVDLKLWPKLTRVSQQTVTSAFATAVERLAHGRILECAELPFDCLEGTEAATSVAAGDVLYATRLREQGPYPDADSIDALFESTRHTYAAFPEARLRQFRAENRDRNAARRAGSAAETARERRQEEAGWEERARRDREHNRREAARKYLDRTLAADIERYREPLDQAVKRINEHRAPADRIELDALIESIRGSDN